MRKILDFFNIPLLDSEELTCCAPSFVSIVNSQTSLLVGARNLVVAEEKERDILTPCSGCFRALKEVQHKLDDEKQAAMANEVLSKFGKNYKGNVKIRHILQVLLEDIGIEKIRENAKNTLKGLKIAAYYGCHLIRPSEISQFDDPEFPRSLDDIIEAFGGSSPLFEGKLDCCGGPLKTINDEISLDLLETKLKSLKKAAVDAVVLACPFCFFQFDFGQREIREAKGVNYNIPILTITELLGLILGLDPKLLGLHLHIIKTKSFIEKFQEVNHLQEGNN